MNLRNVTKWTTAVMPIVAFGTILCTTRSGIIGALFISLFSAPPFVAILLIARKIKYNIPRFILLVSTFLCTAWLAYGVAIVIIYPTDAQSGLVLGLFVIFSLPVMSPLWILATCLDSDLAKKHAPKPHVVIRINDAHGPGTAASTPSSPALLGGESEVK